MSIAAVLSAVQEHRIISCTIPTCWPARAALTRYQCCTAQCRAQPRGTALAFAVVHLEVHLWGIGFSGKVDRSLVQTCMSPATPHLKSTLQSRPLFCLPSRHANQGGIHTIGVLPADTFFTDLARIHV